MARGHSLNHGPYAEDDILFVGTQEENGSYELLA
jgi:hypothetical protein